MFITEQKGGVISAAAPLVLIYRYGRLLAVLCIRNAVALVFEG
jgi:hypothetical protein